MGDVDGVTVVQDYSVFSAVAAADMVVAGTPYRAAGVT